MSALISWLNSRHNIRLLAVGLTVVYGIFGAISWIVGVLGEMPAFIAFALFFGLFIALPAGIAAVPWLFDRSGRSRAADMAMIVAGLLLAAYGAVTSLIGGLGFIAIGLALALTRLIPSA